jgi:hypothetical protein
MHSLIVDSIESLGPSVRLIRIPYPLDRSVMSHASDGWEPSESSVDDIFGDVDSDGPPAAQGESSPAGWADSSSEDDDDEDDEVPAGAVADNRCRRLGRPKRLFGNVAVRRQLRADR